jgi:ABC-type lipoprotein export system ATPase subunit
MSSDAPAARTIALAKTYRLPTGPVPALRAVDVEMPAHAVTVVAGPSGSGKSTLLRQLALVERPTAGTVVLGGVDTAALSNRARRQLRRERIAYVFQRPTDNLVEEIDAAGQLELAARLRGAPPPDSDEILGRLGLLARRHHAPYRLSGGEQQRLALAAAFASGAPLIVADEPTAQLDRASGAAVVAGLVALRQLGATVVVSSHDPAVIGAGEHVVRLVQGEVRG